MQSECRYCGSTAVVPVLDKRIENSPTAGNKFRTICQGCDRWLPMCGKEDWQEHPEPHVLPADEDPNDDPTLVPLEEYDYQDELEELAERVEEQGVESEPEEAVADGGDEPDLEADDGDGEESEDVEEEPVNTFECPACGAGQTGYPDECSECGAPYEWGEEAA